MEGFAVASAALLALFVGLSIWRFGLQKSYSSFAEKWAATIPIHNANLWSVVTVAVGFLLIPPMIEQGTDSPLQFLGFFAPLYLFVAALTPKYNHEHKQRVAHILGASLCAISSLLWMFLAVRRFWPAVICAAIVAVGAFATRTERSSLIFWGEMALFASVYSCIIF